MTELRPYQPEDLEALYAICVATGLSGGDASHIYMDKKLLGHVYAAPYAVLDPELSLVAVDDDGVAGYIVGTHDTASWEDRLEREWWPRLRDLYSAELRDHGSEHTHDQERIATIFDPERTPEEVAAAYPAHVHMNLLPRLQGQGIGKKLLDAWLDVAATRGVEALHIGANRGNFAAIRFWGRQHFVDIATEEPEWGTLWMGRHR